MNYKKILAALAATAVATTMAVSASAAITNPNTDEANRYVLKLNEIEDFDVNYNDIYGVTFTFTGTADAEQTNGGAVAWQGQDVNWTQADFTLDDLKDNTFTVAKDEPLFPAAELDWAQVIVAQWDGDGQMDMTIDAVKLLDKDGNVLAAFGDKAEEVKPDEEDNKQEEDNKADEEDNKPSDDNSATGVTSGLAFAGIALAGAAVVATKKNK